MAAGQQDSSITREIIRMVSHKKVWRIPNFDLICQNHLLVNAQKFTLKTNVDNTTCSWLVSLHKTADPALPYYHSLYLECQLCEIQGNNPSVQATLKIDKNEKKTMYAVGHKEQFRVGYVSEGNNDMLSWDGSATINFELIIHEQESAEKCIESSFATRSVEILKENMANLLMDEESSDLKIITRDGMEIPGHRIILQTQNPVFASMLRSDLSESKTGVVNVDDVGGRTMKIILHYLYTGDLPATWSEPGFIAEFTYAAGKYQLTEVLKMMDASLGKGGMLEGHAYCIMPLLNLTSKLSLRDAEKRLLKLFREEAAKAETAEELFALMGNHHCNITTSASNQVDGQDGEAVDGE